MLVVISSCKPVDLESGRIPLAYVPFVRHLEGRYKGLFDSKEIYFDVYLEGDYLRVIPSRDLLGEECFSKIGDIKTVFAETNDFNYDITNVDFVFNPNKCRRENEENLLHIKLTKFNHKITLNVSIIEDKETNKQLTGVLSKIDTTYP
jgi:hypothetical protein